MPVQIIDGDLFQIQQELSDKYTVELWRKEV